MAAISAIMAILSGLASATGSGIAASKGRETERSLMANKSELDREYNEGVLDDEGSKAYFRALDRNVRDNMRGIDNSVVSTGATSENRLAQAERANEVVSNAVGNLLQREEDKKMNLFKLRSGVSAQLASEKARQAQNWVDLASNVSKSASALGESYLDEARDSGRSVIGSDGSNAARIQEPQSETVDGLARKTTIESTKNIRPILSGDEQDTLRSNNVASTNNQMAGQIMAGDGSEYDDERRLGDYIDNVAK